MTAADLALFRALFAPIDDAYGIVGPDGKPDIVRRPLTDNLIMAHIKGQERVGAFFIDSEGKAYQLVIDIDEMRPDLALIVASVFLELGIECYIEASKSKGFHVRNHWEYATAADLRRIGAYVAAKAGIPDAEVFPKQALRPGPPKPGDPPGVGNFMWFPLHGGSLRDGKTAILDMGNGLDPLRDQWEALANVRINPPEVLGAALATVETWEKTAGKSLLPKTATAIGEKLATGKRRPTLFSVACSLRRRGADAEEILPALRVMNERRCDPKLPEEELAKLAMGAMRYAPAGDSEPAPEEAPETEPAPLEFPTHVMSGAAGAFARLYAAHLEVPPPFLYMAFLTCLGSVVADRLTLNSEIAPQPRLYVLLLGESADDRKSTAIGKTVEFFGQAVFEGFAVCRGVGSAEGLQQRLSKDGRMVLALDELKQFVSKCRIDGSVLLPCVNTLFESTRYEAHTKQSTIKLERAYLSLLAASTISTYENTWSSQFTDIGFNNRLWIVTGGAERKFSIPEKVPETDKFMLRQKLAAVLMHIEGHRELDIAPGARALYHEWYMNLERSIHAKRLDTYALRFMALLAANDLKPEVDEETVRKVVALADHQFRIRQLYDPIDADSRVAAMEEKIRRVPAAKGALGERDLKQFTNANRAGLWIYDTAKQNLRRAGEIGFDAAKSLYFLRREAKT